MSMSLGLVSYDDSDESDNEIESSNIPPKNETIKTVVKEESVYNSNRKQPDNLVNEKAISKNDSENAFNFNLPQSNKSLLNTDIDIKCLTSTIKKNGPVKIAIPSLSEIDDTTTEEPSRKKLKPSQKGSGLFALLPSPKSSMVVPQAVTNRNRLVPNKKPNPITKKTPVSKAPSVAKTSLISYEDSEDEEETSPTVDFFSLDKDDEVVATPVEDVDIDLTVGEPTVPTPTTHVKHQLNSSQSNYQSTSWEDTSNYVPSGSTSSYPTQEFMTFNNSNLELDDEAMQKLCGRRDRMKREEVNIIDVSGDTLMPDSREWLTKQLTEEQTQRPSHKKRDGPTSQQKRKHQITYLAFQAKESELELKNQWANNRLSRKQTQSKYGF